MKTSPSGRNFIKREEGSRSRAYQDSRGIWTIGVGHTTAAGPPVVTQGLVLSDLEIDKVLEQDLQQTEDTVNSLVKVPLSQNEFDALVSLVFNIGPGGFRKSSVLRLLNQDKRQEAANAFLLWKKAGNDPDILLPRRNRERTLFMQASQKPKEAPQDVPATPVAPTPSNWLVRLWLLILKAFR